MTSLLLSATSLRIPGLSKSPLKDAITTHKWQTFIVFAVVCLWASGFYLCHVWVRTFMGTLLDPPTKGADGIAAGALIFLCFAFPAMGLASDVYQSRRKVMLCGGVAVVLLSVPLFAVLAYSNSSGISFLSLCVFAVAMSAWGSPMCAWMVEAFPVESRYSAVAIGYNAAHALLGGTILLVAQVLVEEQGKLAPAVLLCFIATVSTLALYYSEKVLGKEKITAFKPIDDAVAEAEGSGGVGSRRVSGDNSLHNGVGGGGGGRRYADAGGEGVPMQDLAPAAPAAAVQQTVVNTAADM